MKKKFKKNSDYFARLLGFITFVSSSGIIPFFFHFSLFGSKNLVEATN